MVIYRPQNDGTNPLLRNSLHLICQTTIRKLLWHPLLVDPPIVDPRDPTKQLMIDHVADFDGIKPENAGLTLNVYPYHRGGSKLNVSSNNAAHVYKDYELGGTGEWGGYDMTCTGILVKLTYRGWSRRKYEIYPPSPLGLDPNATIRPEYPRGGGDFGPGPGKRQVIWTTMTAENALWDYIELVKIALTSPELRNLTVQLDGCRIGPESCRLNLAMESSVEWINPVTVDWVDNDSGSSGQDTGAVYHSVELLWKLRTRSIRFWDFNALGRNVLDGLDGDLNVAGPEDFVVDCGNAKISPGYPVLPQDCNDPNCGVPVTYGSVGPGYGPGTTDARCVELSENVQVGKKQVNLNPNCPVPRPDEIDELEL